MTTLLNTILSLYIASLTPDYAIAINSMNDFHVYICQIPDHCDPSNDECLDTFQSFDTEHECFDCSRENSDFRDFCDENIPFEYFQHIDNTFGYIDTNITVNLMQIVHTDMFSIDDYLEIMSTFSADCLEYPEPSVCDDALFLSENLPLFLEKRNVKFSK